MGSIGRSNGVSIQANMNRQSNGIGNCHTNGNPTTINNADQMKSPNDEFQVAEPIAIIGMAMRLPGGIRDSEALWDFLVNKKSGRCRVPENRYNVDAFYGPGKVGHIGTEYGYFLEGLDLANLDLSFWSMTKQEAEAVDPAQRLMLEVVYECLENSGAKQWRGQNIGCYIGSFGEDWLDMELKDDQNTNMYRMAGYSDFATSNRVSYEFDFRGPSMTLRTACSSSLTGLHEACMALARGDCTTAVVGGASIITAPRMTVALTDQGVLSPTGICRTFDANADGYARGEGVCALYVKKLSDAVRDGDPIRAVIRSTCVASDGKTPGLTMPSTEGHEALIRRGHRLAGFTDFSKTAMIECHGTGTKVGDPIETKAVARVFGDHGGVYIGSIKPNLGHSEGNSGLASVIKMVLALEKKIIPPNINFTTPHPDIPFEKASLVVPLEPTPWPEDRLERVGVNSFGIGGANAHVLLESATSLKFHRSENQELVETEAKLLVFSAKHSEALQELVDMHKNAVLGRPQALADISYTLTQRREFHPYRSFCIASPSNPLEMYPATKVSEPTKLIFTFTGQGAQWGKMGQQLIETSETFRASIQALELYLGSLPEPPEWSLENEILAPKHDSRLAEAEFSQPCCTAIQIALVDLLSSWNIKPSAVIGHSSGEISGAYACGAITANEAIMIAYYRGISTKGLGSIHSGGMAAIGLGRSEVAPFLQAGVIIGCDNSPGSVTLSGDIDVLEGIMKDIQQKFPDVLVRSLRVECAYHSYHMSSVSHQYARMLAKRVNAKEPQVPFYSSVLGKIVKEEGALSGPYWVNNLISPVLFRSAVELALSTLASPKTFLEIGPHSALAGPIRQTLNNEKGVDYVPTVIRNSNSVLDLLNTAGQLWLRKIDVDFTRIIPQGQVLTNLPPYPWHYQDKYWAESRLSRDWRLRKFLPHDILGTRVVQSTDINPSWRKMLKLDHQPWIREHEIAQDILFPAAGFIAMIGEAIRQLFGSLEYTLRRVSITTALVLQEDNVVEIVTNLRPVRLTTTLDSAWYDFSVSSLSGKTWTKHITGQVKSGEGIPSTPLFSQSLDRNVLPSAWYSVMKRFGMNYGPKFRCLRKIHSHVSETKASALLVQEQPDPKDSTYPLHPTMLDSSFQLLTVAFFKGIPRFFDRLFLPVSIEELCVRPTQGAINVQAETFLSGAALSGNLLGTSPDGSNVFSIKNMQFSSLGDNGNSSDPDPHAATELQWDRDLNFLDAATLMKPAKDITAEHHLLEKFALACMIETSQQLRTLECKAQFMRKFRAWNEAQREIALEDKYPNVTDSAKIVSLSSHERTTLINELFSQLCETEAAAVSTAVHRIFQSNEAIFTGETDPLDLLLQDDVLTSIYDYMQLWDYGQFFKLLSHYKPNLKILEIGAGTGGTTSTILPFLRSEYGERMFSSYTYTDISAGFFPGAKERFKDVDGLKYAILDISKDPAEQGFELESFDLIVACNVLHATPSLSQTLTNVRKLLQPRGRLLLQELTPRTKWTNYVMGVLPGWWLGEADGRIDEPYVTPKRWEVELKGAGFGGINAITFDGQFNSNIIAMPACQKHSLKRITILQGISNTNKDVQKHFKESGFEIDLCTLDGTPNPGQTIVSLLDLNAPFIHNVSENDFKAIRDFLGRIKDSGILWITGACQINCKDPRYSLILGFARTIRAELQIDIATLELENFDTEAWKTVTNVLHQFEHRVQEDMKPVLEYAYSGGAVKISNFHWISVSEQLAEKEQQSLPKQLAVIRPGSLQTMCWKQVQPMPSLDPDWVEVEPAAIGLNFRDVMITMGLVTDPKQENGAGALGCECSGVIRNVGSNVDGFKVGDRVICVAGGSFASTLTASKYLCTRMSDALSFVEAATMPCVYSTVIYSVIDLGRLNRDQSILIHSACGGVGIAAIQVAKMIGAEIFCTVGNEEKVDYLVSTFGISRNRIFNSRDVSFLRHLMIETSNRGVDLVLNSLSGELLHASWDCVAEFGTMIEIGKRDFIGRATLEMSPFLQNRSFMGVDISQMCADRPKIMNSLLIRMIDLFNQGHIKPIQPIKEFEASKVEDAFRYMQKGQHIGKIVVSLANQADKLLVKTDSSQLFFSPDKAYLLVGGLGGLGRSVASWLVQSGARHVIFFSRSAGSVAKNDPYFLELEAQGCTVQAVSGDVCRITDIRKAILEAKKQIGGILQASMVLNDAALLDMTFEQWQAATLPKVQGTWNLHKLSLLQKEPLDFFVMFSSSSGVGGQPGQANYAAANTFLDSFVQYRHTLDLPASVLDIGAMDDVGYLNQNADILEAHRAGAIHILHEQDLLDSLQLMINRSHPQAWAAGIGKQSQIAIGMRSSLPLSAPNNRTLWKRDPRAAVYHNFEVEDTAISHGPTNDNNLKQLLFDASTNPILLSSPESIRLLAKEIGSTLQGFMMREELDISVPLSSIGVDSLVSIELRNWLRQKIGAEFTPLEIMRSENIEHLGSQAAAKLGDKFRARS